MLWRGRSLTYGYLKRGGINMKKIGFIIGIVAVVSILGLGIYHSSASKSAPTLTKDEIKELVEAQYPGTIVTIEVGKDVNKTNYMVEIDEGERKYTLQLDGNSGEILHLKEKKVTKQANDDDKNKKKNAQAKQTEDKRVAEEEKEKKEKPKDKQERERQPKDEEVKEKQEKTNSKEANQQTEQKQKEEKPKTEALMNIEEVSQIALKEFSGTITEVELDEEDGRLIYEIEIEAGDQEAELEIDAHTGEVLIIEIDD